MIGIDVVDVERFRALLDRAPNFVGRFFTTRERAHCYGFSDPAVHFAGTLAAKEAVMKALSIVPAPAFARRIEIERPGGAPVARYGDSLVHVSIAHDGPVATAIAVAPPHGPT